MAGVVLISISMFLGFAGATSSWELGISQLPPAIFQFGDSLSDTGNSLIAFPHSFNRLNSSPYGETFFHRPSGRECDGRLIIDFLASGYGLPLLQPYLQKGKDRRHGVNFAVCGAPALELDFFDKHNISIRSPGRDTFPLHVQLQWFREFKDTSLLHRGKGSHPSPDDFSQALYIVGEIGGNDYGIMRGSGMSYSQMLQLVPFVVRKIRGHIQELYNLGARNFLVINIPPEGCNPGTLVSRGQDDRLDKHGCVDDFNEVNVHHNSLLRNAVDDLRISLTNASISYADFFGVMGAVLDNPKKYGFADTCSACCGTPLQNWIVDCAVGGMVNGAMTMGRTCKDPSTYVYWNGGHFTERFYSVVAEAFLGGKHIYTGKASKIEVDS